MFIKLNISSSRISDTIEDNYGDYLLPRNELEKKICTIWSKILGISSNKISVKDSFYSLGGNSILAIKLVNQINKELGIDIRANLILKYNTIEKILEHLRFTTTKGSILINKVTINRPEEQLLSFNQERLWFIEKYEHGTNAYNIPMFYRLSKDINLEVLEKSVKNIVIRHEILRTIIKEDNYGKSYQVVLNEEEYPFRITRMTVPDKILLDYELQKQANYIYDLSNEYPIRISIITVINGTNCINEEYYFSVVIHHIAFDGWSMEIFFKELQEYYNFNLKKLNAIDTPLNLSELTVQYKDFSLWQRRYFSLERLDKQLNFWKNKLNNYEILYLYNDKPRQNHVSYEGNNLPFEINLNTSNSLREITKKLNISLHTLLLASYCLALRVHTNQDDIIIGIPLVNRHYNQIENLIGFFVNILPIRVRIHPKDTIIDFIKNVEREVIEVQLYQDLPFEKLVEELNIVKDSSRHPIFQIMFGVEIFDTNIENQAEGLNNIINLLEEYKPSINVYSPARFDISTFIKDKGSKLSGNFNYSTYLYNKNTIENIVNTYINILEQLTNLNINAIEYSKVKVSDLNYLGHEQYQKIIYQHNNTNRRYSNKDTILKLFEDQVKRNPDNIAIIHDQTKITYKELNQKVNQLANYLKKIGAVPETVIACCLEQPINMVISMLAIMKSSGIYLPIDYNCPDDRIRYILRDAKVFILLTQDKLAKKFRKNVISLINLDFEWNNIQKESDIAPIVHFNSNNLVYIIYTSGSTGNPKGVMIEHKSLSNLINSLSIIDSIDSSDCFLQNVSFCFDPSMWTTLWPLINGATLVTLENENLKDPQLIIKCIKENFIKILHIGPSLLRLVFTHNEIKECISLKHIIGGGEAWNLEDINLIKKNIPDCYFTNVYGPTEATIHVTTWTCYSKNLTTNKIPIGLPIANTQIYILDKYMMPVPIGVIGELCIGGVGLARGYFNKADLTAEKFIANPFQNREEGKRKENTRLYKTGDLAKWTLDGNIEYVGRNDFQVKIRGYRIELQEIEKVLSSYNNDVKQSVVIIKDYKYVTQNLTNVYTQFIVGYYISDVKLNEIDILNYLQSKLPEYMVPNMLIHLQSLPLNINGKIDIKALPAPKPTDIRIGTYIAPENALEISIRDIWAETLGLSAEQISITDDFFKVGGDSIISIQLVSRLRQRLGLYFSAKDIFDYRNIKKLSAVAATRAQIKQQAKTKIEQGILSGKVELLPIQEWFFSNNFKKPNHWNQSFIIKTPKLDLNQLCSSINKLITYHDIFRIRYRKMSNNIYTQYYDHSINTLILLDQLKVLNIKILQCKEESKNFKKKLNYILTNWQQDFEIESGKLYSVGYLYGYSDGTSRIYFALHHLIVDSISWRIIAEDLEDLYYNQNLVNKTSSYRQWSNVIKNYPNIYKEEIHYWNNVLAEYSNNCNLAKLVRKNINKKNISVLILTKKQTRVLLRESNKVYDTQINDILLTALGSMLYEITGNNINYITLESHGREEIDDSIDISRTVGWFTTMYPVRLEVDNNLKSSILLTQKTLKQIPNKGLGYGAIIGYKLQEMPKIIFNYLGQFSSKNSRTIPKSNYWNIVIENSGIAIHPDNEDHNLITINGLITNNKLELTIISKLTPKYTKELRNIYKSKLLDIINYSINENTGDYNINSFKDFVQYESFFSNSKYEDNHNIFIFPPGNGGAESYYNNIVPHMKNRNLILFNNYYTYLINKFGTESTKNITFEKLAEEYVKCIKLIKPNGPYILLGWSFGGVLAFEVARLLISMGQKIQGLILIDPFFNSKEVAINLKIKNRLSRKSYINYKYSPLPLSTNNLVQNIILFKAIKPPTREIFPLGNKTNDYEIFEYYAKNVPYNNLEQIISKEKFKIIRMDDSHFSWINNNLQLKRICDTVEEIIMDI